MAASPFDAALHDACGRALGRSSFRTLAPELVGHDLSRYLGPDFTGTSLEHVVRARQAETVPLFHSVGGSDPLTAAEARRHGMFVCVQDLTCPGAALVHSAGIAAWVPGVAGIEANARQYVPAANRPWEDRLPGIFRVTDGSMHTTALGDRPGLGTGDA